MINLNMNMNMNYDHDQEDGHESWFSRCVRVSKRNHREQDQRSTKDPARPDLGGDRPIDMASDEASMAGSPAMDDGALEWVLFQLTKWTLQQKNIGRAGKRWYKYIKSINISQSQNWSQFQPTCFHSGLSLWKSECFACPKGFEPQNVCFDNGNQISGPKQCSCSCCSPVALVFITGLSWTRSRPKCTIHLQVFCLKTVWRCHVHQFCTKVKTASVRAYAAFSVHGMKWLVQIAVHLTFLFLFGVWT